MNELRVPELGGTVVECIVVAWLKTPGEAVAQGEPLVEVTADKATLLLESPADGVLLAAVAAPKMVVPVQGVLGVVGKSGDSVAEEILSLRYPLAQSGQACRFHPGMDEPSGACVMPSAMRSVLSRRMVQSKERAPHWYLVTRVDMTACMTLRKTLKAEGEKATYNDMVIRAVALALREFPIVAAAATDCGVVMRPDIHIGFACAVSDDELLVPVIRHADRLSLGEIGAASRELSSRARNHTLMPADFVGGVFTVSNLGSFDAEIFVPIINPGESAILGVGAIQDTPCAVGGEVVIRPIMHMTLSSDHRVVDGVLGAKFSKTLKRLLETPELLRDDGGG